MPLSTPAPPPVSQPFDVVEVLTEAHKRSVRLPADEQAHTVVIDLGGKARRGMLGIEGHPDDRELGPGGPIKGLDAEHRLQVLYRVTTAVVLAYTPAVAAAFWRGTNPVLGGRAPMLVLADGDPADVEPDLLGAAEALLSA